MEELVRWGGDVGGGLGVRVEVFSVCGCWVFFRVGFGLGGEWEYLGGVMDLVKEVVRGWGVELGGEEGLMSEEVCDLEKMGEF